MDGLRITDLDERGGLAVDLKSILSAGGSGAIECLSRCSHVWATTHEDATETLEEVAASGRMISGARLMELAHQTYWVEDGLFECFMPGAERPWFVIDVVDSTFWDVRSEDPGLLDRLRAEYHQVTRLPPDAA